MLRVVELLGLGRLVVERLGIPLVQDCLGWGEWRDAKPRNFVINFFFLSVRAQQMIHLRLLPSLSGVWHSKLLIIIIFLIFLGHR